MNNVSSLYRTKSGQNPEKWYNKKKNSEIELDDTQLRSTHSMSDLSASHDMLMKSSSSDHVSPPSPPPTRTTPTLPRSPLAASGSIPHQNIPKPASFSKNDENNNNKNTNNDESTRDNEESPNWVML